MSKPSPSPLEAHLGFWLRFVSNHVSQAFAAKLARMDVSVAEWVMLRELYDRAEAPPSLIAERLGFTRGAVTKLADRLAAKTLVAKSAGAGDRRYRALSLTAAGRALVPRLAALADANDSEFFGQIPARDRDRIAAAMRAIVRVRGWRGVPID